MVKSNHSNTESNKKEISISITYPRAITVHMTEVEAYGGAIPQLVTQQGEGVVIPVSTPSKVSP